MFYTEVRWLSRSKILARLFELRNEVRQFLLKQNMTELHQLFEDNHWMAKLAYMADILEHLNKKMQSRSENYLTCSDKLMGFKNKLELWQKELQKRSLETFQRTTYKSMIKNKQLILDLIQQHLSLLQEKFKYSFFTIRSNTIGLAILF